MSLFQVKFIQIGNVECNLVGHQDKFIEALCINPQCNESSTLCSKCLIKGHPQCRNQVHELKEIPKQLIELQELQLAVVTLQDKINIQFTKLHQRIEQFLQPVSNFQDSITNLNEIGLFLRQLPKHDILQSIYQTKIEINRLLDCQNRQQERVQEQQMQSAEDWNNKGNALEKQDNYDEAIKCYEEAIRIDPNNSQYWNNKGNALFYYDNYDEAIKCYEEATKIDPKNGAYWNNKGESLYDSGNYDEAIQCLEKAIQIDKNNCQYWNSKGKALNCQGNYDEAIKCFQEAIKIDPNNDQYWNNTGASLENLGNYDEAIKCLEKAIQINPNNYLANRNLNKVKGKKSN